VIASRHHISIQQVRKAKGLFLTEFCKLLVQLLEQLI